VRQLQPDHQIISGTGGAAMLLKQNRTKPHKIVVGFCCSQELIRIGPSVLAYRHSLSAPNELSGTAAESLPAPKRILCGMSVKRSIPPFHRLNGDAITNF
jgi:hypothetical protein